MSPLALYLIWSNFTSGGNTMTKLIKSIAAVLNAETGAKEYRFSRGMGPRPAPAKHDA